MVTDNAANVDYEPNRLLDVLIKHLNLKNDVALCRLLQIAPSVLSRIRHHHLPVGPSILLRMHDLTGISIGELRELMGDRSPPLHKALQQSSQLLSSADANIVEPTHGTRLKGRKTLSPEMVDALLAEYHTIDDLLGEGGLLRQLTSALVERALQVEMSNHLNYDKNYPVSITTEKTVANAASDTPANIVVGAALSTAHSGWSRKTFKGAFDVLPMKVSGERNRPFVQRSLSTRPSPRYSIKEAIFPLTATAMALGEDQTILRGLHRTEVAPKVNSSVANAVMDEVSTWQARPLETLYLIVYLDSIDVMVRERDAIQHKVMRIAIGINLDGMKEVLGMWIVEIENANFWLHVVTDLKNRGVADIFIVCIDRLQDFPATLETVFPMAKVQYSIAHMVRHSLNDVSSRQREEVAADLRCVYAAATADEALRQLDHFEEKWGDNLAMIGQSWRRNLSGLAHFFAYPADIRKVIYTTNATGSININLRRVTKAQGTFTNDEAVFKSFYLVLGNLTRKWTMPIRNWKTALNSFTTHFKDRTLSSR